MDAILLAAAGCYALKLAGLSVPQRVLDGARVQRVALLLPVALLAALICDADVRRGPRRARGRARRGGRRAAAARAVPRRGRLGRGRRPRCCGSSL